MLAHMRFTTPSHFCTAQRGGYASGTSAARVAFVAEAFPPIYGAWPLIDLPAMNRWPVQSARSRRSVPAASPKPLHEKNTVLVTKGCSLLDSAIAVIICPHSSVNIRLFLFLFSIKPYNKSNHAEESLA